jgi:hypothetical protein
MPNWCSNNFKLVGNKESLDEIENNNFSFAYFIPPPHDATHEWYIENWCADRECKGLEMVRAGEDTLFVMCNTAWTPPFMFMRRLVEIFPDLYIFNQFVVEPDMNCGIIMMYIHDGQVRKKEFRWYDPVGKEGLQFVHEGW